MGGGLPDSRSRPHHGHDLPIELLLGRQAAQLRLLERPVLDVEGLLLVHRLVLVDGLGSAHHLDGAVVELRGDPRLALVLPPRDHAQPGDQDHRGVGVAHGRRVLALAAVVVGRVVATVALQAFRERRLQGKGVAARGIPVGEERLDLGAQEVIGAGGPERGQARPVDASGEAQGVGIVLHGGHEPALRGDPSAKPGQDLQEQAAPLGLRQQRMALPPEGAQAAIPFRDVGRGAIDDLKRGLVADLVVVAPRAHAVVAEKHAPGGRLLADARFDEEAEVEAGALPGDVGHVVPVDLPAEALLVHRRGHRDHRVRMEVVHVLVGNEGVQRSIDRAGAGVQVEHAMAVEVVHQVFDGCLRPALGLAQVASLHRAHPVQVERGEAVRLRGPKVSTGTLDPEDLNVLSREGIPFPQLGRRVAAAGVGEGEVGAEGIGTIDEPVEALEVADLVVAPTVLDVLQWHAAFLPEAEGAFWCPDEASARRALRPGIVPRNETQDRRRVDSSDCPLVTYFGSLPGAKPRREGPSLCALERSPWGGVRIRSQARPRVVRAAGDEWPKTSIS